MAWFDPRHYIPAWAGQVGAYNHPSVLTGPDGQPQMGANFKPIYGTSLMGTGGGTNNPASMDLPPLDPRQEVPDNMVPVPANVPQVADVPVAPPAPSQPTTSPITDAMKNPPTSWSSIGSQLAGGDFKGALGALGGSKGFMDAAGGLAKTLGGGGGQQQRGAPPPPPQLDTNSTQIAQAAPQLMANIMAKRRIPGMSIGGMGMMG